MISPSAICVHAPALLPSGALVPHCLAGEGENGLITLIMHQTCKIINTTRRVHQALYSKRKTVFEETEWFQNAKYVDEKCILTHKIV